MEIISHTNGQYGRANGARPLWITCSIFSLYRLVSLLAVSNLGYHKVKLSMIFLWNKQTHSPSETNKPTVPVSTDVIVILSTIICVPTQDNDRSTTLNQGEERLFTLALKISQKLSRNCNAKRTDHLHSCYYDVNMTSQALSTATVQCIT